MTASANRRGSSQGGQIDVAKIKSQRSAILRSVADHLRQTVGVANVACGGEASQLCIGLRVPLAFQILIQSNVLPLGKCIVIVGEEGVGKSALIFEIARWASEYGGFLHYVENESKFDPVWANSILGYADETGSEVYNYYPSNSVESWQGILTTLLEETKKIMLDKKGLGVTYPVVFGLDTIAGKLAQSSAEKISKDGYAGRGAPTEALVITRYMKKFATEIAEWPFVFVGANHEKSKVEMDGMLSAGGPKVYRPGGKHMDYQEAIEIRMSQAGKSSRIRLVDDSPDVLQISGMTVRLSTRKNSEGDTYREISVPVVWRFRKTASGELRQYTAWDWYAALVDHLLHHTGELRAKVARVVDITKTARGYSCKQFPETVKQPVDKTQLGRLICGNAALVEGIQDLYAVIRRREFVAGVDYRKQRQAAIDAARRIVETKAAQAVQTAPKKLSRVTVSEVKHGTKEV